MKRCSGYEFKAKFLYNIKRLKRFVKILDFKLGQVKNMADDKNVNASLDDDDDFKSEEDGGLNFKKILLILIPLLLIGGAAGAYFTGIISFGDKAETASEDHSDDGHGGESGGASAAGQRGRHSHVVRPPGVSAAGGAGHVIWEHAAGFGRAAHRADDECQRPARRNP